MSSASGGDLRLLFVTQELDRTSANLAVAHTWAAELARQSAAVHVLAARVGEVNLPPNVHVHGLGRERGRSRWTAALAFGAIGARLILGRRVDVIVAHMVPAYAVAMWPLARVTPTTLALWYASHGLTPMLRRANQLIDVAVTASPDSYPILSDQAFVLGHGIDTRRFRPPAERSAETGPVIGMAGRLTPLKGFEPGIQALAELRFGRFPDARLRIAGEPFYASDRGYVDELERLADRLGVRNAVEFIGAVRGDAMAGFYGSLDVFVNWRAQPALDKTGLEALACGTPLVTNNSAYGGVLGDLARNFLVGDSSAELSAGLDGVLSLSADARRVAVGQLRAMVLREHGAPGLAARLTAVCSALRTGARPDFPSVTEARTSS
ncbi:MAG: glycosyltransferase family 4 protein [Chloroflexota bacterium]|nr:glycosyltransferase family 4 protein [Chloroflexota bacterium]MDE2918433.1 glycosyltransferase family 4 protein [Chloroflexota bacterium]